VNKIILLILLGVVSLWGLEFHSYEEALKIQKKTKKIMMIDVMRTECHYCIEMEKKYLMTPNVFMA